MVDSSLKKRKSFLAPDKIANFFWKVIRGVIVAGISFMIIYPILIRFLTSFMTERDFYDPSVQFVARYSNIGEVLYHYRLVWQSMNYPVTFAYTLSFALIVSFFQLISCTLVGYGLARFDFRGTNLIFALVIIALLIPPQLLMIPIFLNFRFFNIFGIFGETGLNLIAGSFWPFVIMAITATGLKNGLFIYIMRQFFKGMPSSLEDSAYVDGAGPFRAFLYVVLPGATPVLLIVFLFSFVWQWNDVFYTNMLLPSDFPLLGLILQHGLSWRNFGFSELYAGGPSVEFISMLRNVGLLYHIIPVLLIYAFLQRYFIESVQRTGIVG